MTRNPLSALLALALAACGGSSSEPPADETPTAIEAMTPTPAPSPAASPTTAPAPPDYVAGGNEPFWSIRTGANTITYSSPEILDGVSLAATVSQAAGWIRFESRMDGAPLILEVRKRPCSDSMSGFAFSHEARLTRADGSWSGCARLASEPQPRE